MKLLAPLSFSFSFDPAQQLYLYSALCLVSTLNFCLFALQPAAWLLLAEIYLPAARNFIFSSHHRVINADQKLYVFVEETLFFAQRDFSH
jgi:hypothetical protein